MSEFGDDIKQLERAIIDTDAKAASLCRKIESINSLFEVKIAAALRVPQFYGINLVERWRPFSVFTPEHRYRRLVRFNGDYKLLMDLDERTRKPLDSLISDYYHSRDEFICENFKPARSDQKRAYAELLDRSTILSFQQVMRHNTTALYISDPEENYIIRTVINKDGGASYRTRMHNTGVLSKEDMHRLNNESKNRNVYYISNPSNYVHGKLLMKYAINTITDDPRKSAERLVIVSNGEIVMENN